MSVNVGVTADVAWLEWTLSDGLMGGSFLTIRAFGFIGSQVAPTATASAAQVVLPDRDDNYAQYHSLKGARVGVSWAG